MTVVINAKYNPTVFIFRNHQRARIVQQYSSQWHAARSCSQQVLGVRASNTRSYAEVLRSSGAIYTAQQATGNDMSLRM
jgi:hypothetical protein